MAKDKKSWNSTQYLIIGVLLALGFILGRAYFKNYEAAPASSPSPAALSPAAEKSAENRGPAPELDNNFKPLSPEKAGRRLAGNVLPIPELEPGVLSLAVRALPRTCSTGDYEMIRNSVRSLDDKSLLIELRSIVPKGSVKIAVNMLDFEGRKTLRLPYSNIVSTKGKSQAFMLFICQDESKKGTCEAKKIFGAKSAKSLDAKDFKDRIYYAQLLVKDAMGLQLFPSAKWDKSSFQKSLELFDGDIGISNDGLEKARLIISNLGSVPASLSGTALEINLPATDPSCFHNSNRHR